MNAGDAESAGADDDVAMCCRFSLCWAHFARGGDEWRAGEAGQWEAGGDRGSVAYGWLRGEGAASPQCPSFPLISRHFHSFPVTS